jgi:hypothetical protein
MFDARQDSSDAQNCLKMSGEIVRYFHIRLFALTSAKRGFMWYASFDPRILCPNYARLWYENRKTALGESGILELQSSKIRQMPT